MRILEFTKNWKMFYRNSPNAITLFANSQLITFKWFAYGVITQTSTTNGMMIIVIVRHLAYDLKRKRNENEKERLFQWNLQWMASLDFFLFQFIQVFHLKIWFAKRKLKMFSSAECERGGWLTVAKWKKCNGTRNRNMEPPFVFAKKKKLTATDDHWIEWTQWKTRKQNHSNFQEQVFLHHSLIASESTACSCVGCSS